MDCDTLLRCSRYTCEEPDVVAPNSIEARREAARRGWTYDSTNEKRWFLRCFKHWNGGPLITTIPPD
jgi:hypothetical protein